MYAIIDCACCDLFAFCCISGSNEKNKVTRLVPGSFYIQGRASVLPFYVVRLTVRRYDAL